MRSGLMRKVILGVGSSLAAAMLAAGGATAAQATTRSVEHPATAAAAARPMSDIADCQAADPTRAYVCWWVGANQTGKMHPVRDAISNWTTQKEATCQSGTWNDCASTLYNDSSSRGAWFYYSANDKGNYFCIVPGTYVNDLTKYDYANSVVPVNDTISSNRWGAANCSS